MAGRDAAFGGLSHLAVVVRDPSTGGVTIRGSESRHRPFTSISRAEPSILPAISAAPNRTWGQQPDCAARAGRIGCRTLLRFQDSVLSSGCTRNVPSESLHSAR